MSTIKHLIDGKAVESAERFVTYNPATQEAIAEVAAGDAAGAEAAAREHLTLVSGEVESL